MANNSNLPSFDFEYCTDKQKVFEHYCKYMFTRTQSMFVYKGLPDTIPVKWLEQYLQRNGSCCIAEVEGKLYALLGNAGGEYDEYYQPTKYVVANPWLNLSKTFTIGEDCVFCRNDYDALGLNPLICRYAGLMTENLLTVRLADINMRMMNLLSAPDDNTLQSTKQYLRDLEDGKLGVVGETPFFEGLKLQSKNLGSGDYMIQFIELQQYFKGSLYNELGINANFNMKREALSGQELAMNDDALMPLIDDMLKQRRAMCDNLNEMFGLNVSVDYGSTWHSNVVEKQLVADTELGASPESAVEAAGDETALPDDKDANAVDEETAAEEKSDEVMTEKDGDVSRLNDEQTEEEQTEEEQTEETQTEEEQTEEQQTEESEEEKEEQTEETQTEEEQTEEQQTEESEEEKEESNGDDEAERSEGDDNKDEDK